MAVHRHNGLQCLRRLSAIIVFPDDEEPTFTKFPELPSEIRAMIMVEAILAPKAITVSRTRKLVKPTGKGGQTVKLPCATVHVLDAYDPAMLHVNKQARQLALKHYRYAFHGRLKKPIYFNFTIDYLQFETGHTIPVFEAPSARLGFGKVDRKISPQDPAYHSRSTSV
ncbi:hypothetical protein IFR05_014693 [Cadophora sp. M221]|nr:hypothetical protein IFR05_014693 [Cadophora sp. M221]